jgi:hypothetical protein
VARYIHGPRLHVSRALAPIRARSRMSGRQSNGLLDLSKAREARCRESVPRKGAGRLAKLRMCRGPGFEKGAAKPAFANQLVPCPTRGAGSDLCTSARDRARKKQQGAAENPRGAQ